MLAIVAMLAAGVSIIVALTATGGRSKPAASAPIQHPSPATNCDFPEPRFPAADAISVLQRNRLPVKRSPGVAPTLPDGACTVSAFRDSRQAGAINVITAYSTPELAGQAVQPLGDTGLAAFIFVVRLDPRLLPHKIEYQAALTSLANEVNPPPPPPYHPTSTSAG